jgi:hypothetical protein
MTRSFSVNMNTPDTMNCVTRKDQVYLVTGKEGTEKEKGYISTHFNVSCR